MTTTETSFPSMPSALPPNPAEDEKPAGWLDKFFHLRIRKTTVGREFFAGLTTFLTMAYILAVNPEILSQAGLPQGAVFSATCIASAIATLCMGLSANLPVALAPGMGLNAFFTYVVVQQMGFPWEVALTAVFLEGLVFILLSLLNLREAMVEAIPPELKKAIVVGMGMFISVIALSNAGILTMTKDGHVLTGFATIMKGGAPLVATVGLIITAGLYALNVQGAVLIGIVLTTILGIPFMVTKLPMHFSLFSLPVMPLFCKFSFANLLSVKFFTVFFTFFYVDVFDTVGTLVGISAQAGIQTPDGHIPKVKQALLSDAVGTVVGAALGTSTVTSFVESTAGVAAGGRTGLSSVFTALLFVLAMFCGNFFLLVPQAATAPALLMVGFMMLRLMGRINFSNLADGIASFVCIIVMPFAYNVADGIAWGLLMYVLLMAITGQIEKVRVCTWILAAVFLLRFLLQ